MDVREIITGFRKSIKQNATWWRLISGPLAFLLIQAYFPQIDFQDYPLMKNAIAVAAWMVTWWILEPVPIFITAFLPLILGTNLKLGSLAELSSEYGNEMVFLFLGGFMIARAIEKFDIHRNIAALIVKRTGTSPFGVLFGFMLATAFLSMWLSNTGTAIMMLPMAMTILKPIPEGAYKNQYSVALLLSIAYSANIGGIATLIGSPPNVLMSGLLAKDYGIDVDFATWSLFGVPIAGILLYIMFLYFKKHVIKDKVDFKIEVGSIQPWTKNQMRVLIIFASTVVFWTFKPLLNVWTKFPLSDAQIALVATVMLFIVPKSKSKETLLNWNDTNQTPWGILFLFGGGLALARILNNGGVLDFFAEQIVLLGISNMFIIILVLIIATIFLTELMSNLALITVLVPIVAKLAETLGLDILALCLPITVAASCAFMLPMATPPNAIVFASQQIKVKDMVRIGFVLNIVSVLVIFGIVALYSLIKG
jgi:solute carrier family 13 (sodium-dependent dicarboxylate transporter), member 2/3/5